MLQKPLQIPRCCCIASAVGSRGAAEEEVSQQRKHPRPPATRPASNRGGAVLMPLPPTCFPLRAPANCMHAAHGTPPTFWRGVILAGSERANG